MKRDYQKLDWPKFGSILLETGDLDPLYYISQLNLEESQLKRFLLAYWCYYSAPLACLLSDIPSARFYKVMRKFYPVAPRGHERRHFRGEKGKIAINKLEEFGPPEIVVDHMTCASNPNRKVTDIIRATKRHYLFGDWIAWKVADMAERVLGLDVDFSKANLLMYDDPVKGVALVRYGTTNAKVTKDEVNFTVQEMLSYFSRLRGFKAPPFRDRDLNVQEIETVLCKFKAHINGFYPLNYDTDEILEALNKRKWGRTAQRLKKLLEKRNDR